MQQANWWSNGWPHTEVVPATTAQYREGLSVIYGVSCPTHKTKQYACPAMPG